MAELSQNDRDDLQQLEEKLWIAEFRYDKQWINQVLAEDFFEFGRSGRAHTRAKCVEAESEPIAATIPLPDLQMRCIAENVAHITYRSEVIDGAETLCAHRSSIWLKTPKGWKLKFHQGTPTTAV